MHRIRMSVVALALFVVAACRDAVAPQPGDGGQPQPEPVAAVEVAPSDLELEPGAERPVRAMLLDRNGRELAGRPVAWSSGNAAVARVDAAGVVTATGIGVTTITALSEGKVGRTTVRVAAVAPTPVASVTIRQGDAIEMSQDTEVQLDAVARAADGTELPGRVATWTSDAPAMVEVSATGVVRALGYGSATITATVEGRSARLQVTVPTLVSRIDIEPGPSVIGVGETLRFTARLSDAAGRPLERTITWSVGDAAIADVNGNGVVTGRRTGITTVTATVEGRSRGVDVWVVTKTNYALATIDGSPLPVDFTTTELDAGGTMRTVHWHVLEGRFTLGSDGRFEQLVSIFVYRDGTAGSIVTYGSLGTYERDVVSGVLTFYLPAGRPPFTGRFEADGGLTVTRRLTPDLPVTTLRHGAP